MNKTDIKSLNKSALKEFVNNLGQPAFRAVQIFEWLHARLATTFDEMTNLGKDFRVKLDESCYITTLKPVKTLESKLDGTMKFAFELADGNIIESVLMRYKHGNTVCVSSQAGCRMGCRFCASTIDGLARNLTPSEILDQIYSINRITGERISNVVIMGSGEPLDNYENVISFIKLIGDERGYNMSRRNITLSTCGLVPEVFRLADKGLPITLAISLHAPNDELRRQTMPIANRYGIAEIMKACEYFFNKTGRRISFEYSVIKGLNDSADTIKELAALLTGSGSHVNLIPVNPIKERNFDRPDDSALLRAKSILEKSGINVTIRRRLGSDIGGSCGQLRRSVSDDAGHIFTEPKGD
ncbi:MAG: 23S rRNA (adenine(2503)-C(2))-methyltransferase RlmN [Lachnospiraceae bacterium]|nr:23S rRNA (adenine(2503)-C(2))-methyltransferase RlmN [Lachnospiraceae bacterium]